MAIPAYYSLLQRGSSGPDVALVQTWLNGVRDACTWYGELKADGKFGISTENAVKEFQLKNKMNVDGKVGANTWNVLYTRYTAKHGLHVPYPGIALRSGSSGGTVRLVQQKLNSLGERLTADGRFGAATAAAVQRFQRRNGLTADGVVGEGTWAKMFECEQPCPLSLALLDRFPLLSFRDVFPRRGGSLSSKGEPLAKPETLRGLPKPLTLGEVALRKQ